MLVVLLVDLRKWRKQEQFSISFLAVTLNFYDILAAPKFIHIYINLVGSKA